MGFLGGFAISRVLLENLAENGTSHSKIVGSIILYLCSSLAAAGGVGEERIHCYIYIFCLYLHDNKFSFSRLFFLVIFILKDLLLNDILVCEQFKITRYEMIRWASVWYYWLNLWCYKIMFNQIWVECTQFVCSTFYEKNHDC